MSQEEKIVEPNNSEEEFDKEAEMIDCEERQLDEEKESRKKWVIACMGFCIFILFIVGAYILR